MSSAKKLQSDIDKTLKKINDGIQAYEDKWEELMECEATHLKEKLEGELKKELKRLQKHRELVKNWANSADVKQKEPLLKARSQIERRMERFKALERESKTKAYSKQGLMREDEPDDPEKAAMRDWLNDMLRQLSTQTDEMEAELEQEQTKRKPDVESVEELESCINTNLWYTERLEQLVRLLDNDAVEPSSLEDIQDLVADHLDRGREPDYVPDMTVFEDFEALFVFDEDSDDGAAEGGGDDSDDDDEPVSPADGPETDPTAEHRAKLKKKATRDTSEKRKAPVVPVVDKVAPIKGISAASPAPAPTPVTAIAPVPASAGAPKPIAGFRSAVRGAAMAAARTGTPLGTDAGDGTPSATSQSPLLSPADHSSGIPFDGGAILGQSVHATSQPITRGRGASLGGASIEYHRASDSTTGADLVESRARLAAWSMRGPPPDASGFSPGMTLEGAAGDAPEVLPLAAAREALLQMQATSNRMPTLPDMEPPAVYMPRRPAPGHASFPARPLAALATPAMASRMSTAVLFFAFYMKQGSFTQYLAARELRKRSWRFHRKYLTWFQRHEKPEVATKTYEKGSYLFFDYERGWCQRVKKDFVFEYAHLEDELK